MNPVILSEIGRKITQGYLAHPNARAFMLQGYPLQQDVFNTLTDGKNFPGFIDDFLPDDWGRKIVARKLKRRFIDQITLMKNMAAWQVFFSVWVLMMKGYSACQIDS
jgi:hypothetical protein